MSPYKPRLIDALIERKLKSAGAVVLRGPRAVGKTTSALHHAASSVRLDPGFPLLAQRASKQPGFRATGLLGMVLRSPWRKPNALLTDLIHIDDHGAIEYADNLAPVLARLLPSH